MIKKILKGFLLFIFVTFFSTHLFAQGGGGISFDPGSLFTPSRFTTSINVLLSIGIIGIIPFIIMSTTSFIRLVIVLGMIRGAIGTQQAPPNPVIVTLALFLTIFVMTPVFQQISQNVIEPYNSGEISQMQALKEGTAFMKEFMLKQTREKDLSLFLEFSRIPRPEDISDVPVYVVIPSFIISELKTAFQIGFLLYIP